MKPSFKNEYSVANKETCLCTNGGFNLETSAEGVHQFHEVLVAVFKTMTEHQGADDVGDNVVEHEMWSKRLPCRCQ